MRSVAISLTTALRLRLDQELDNRETSTSLNHDSWHGHDLQCSRRPKPTVRVPVVSSLPHRRSEDSLHMFCEVEFAARLDL
jgi:hypothetical protein